MLEPLKPPKPVLKPLKPPKPVLEPLKPPKPPLLNPLKFVVVGVFQPVFAAVVLVVPVVLQPLNVPLL